MFKTRAGRLGLKNGVEILEGDCIILLNIIYRSSIWAEDIGLIYSQELRGRNSRNTAGR
jgi:hypothetical protein